MIQSNLLSICFIRAVALALIASLHLTAMAQAQSKQPESQNQQTPSANRIATPIKTWPEPGSPMELLPKIEFQPLTDEDMRNAFAIIYAKEKPPIPWDRIKQKVCLTKFWQKKPTDGENPFMINSYDGLSGFVKINGYVAASRPSASDKLGNPGDYGKGQLDAFFIAPIQEKLRVRAPKDRYVILDLRKTSERSCALLDSKCKIYSADAYLYWVGLSNVDGQFSEGPREDLRSVYIEDHCYKNEFKTQLFYHRFQPNILERIVGFFFSLS